MSLLEAIDAVLQRTRPPDADEYAVLLERTITVLQHEDILRRPRDQQGLSGGFLELHTDIPTIVLPDLHARMDFFSSVLQWSPDGDDRVADLLTDGRIQILCLGDGFHAERRSRERWQTAFTEYGKNWKKHTAMDQEMQESLGLMEMVQLCKRACRDHFHFLKGNHENILNEEGEGNHPFRKFAWEGEMVRHWVETFYGTAFLELYALFEKCLPLFARGGSFLASHAEPAVFFNRQKIINARQDPDVILGLTWTDNEEADLDSVGMYLQEYLGGRSDTVYLAGHRSVSGRFALRSQGRFIQFHNPDSYQFALVPSDRPFDPETDIINLTESTP